MADKTLGAYNIFDLRDMAQRRVPKGLFEFVDRGTEDEVALRNNRAIFERIKFKPLVDAVGHRVPVLVDSGYRRGSDIVKALALGAAAVLVGRATLYGTAAAGEAGATRAIDILREETDRVMALLGCRSIEELGPELLHFADPAFAAISRRGKVRPLHNTKSAIGV